MLLSSNINLLLDTLQLEKRMKYRITNSVDHFVKHMFDGNKLDFPELLIEVHDAFETSNAEYKPWGELLWS